MNGRVLFISPHSDDIAYSIGGTAAKILQNRVPKRTLVSVFTRSKYGPGLKIKSPQRVTRIRKREDERFARTLQMLRIDLNFPEPALRGYLNNSAIFDATRPDKDPISPKVEREICRLANEFGNNTILVAPLGLGNHVDHLITRNACLVASRKYDLSITFYEDLPYASHLSTDKILRVARRFRPPLVPLLSDITRFFSRKMSSLLIYDSQQVDLVAVAWHGFRVAQQSGKVAERFWTWDPDCLFWTTDHENSFKRFRLPMIPEWS